MNTSRFEEDDVTGLWKWPVLINGDWSRWTGKQCLVLWGQFSNCGQLANNKAILQKVSTLLRSSAWPGLAVFEVVSCGVLIFAPCYSPAQALLLTEHINRELRQTLLPSQSTYSSSDAVLTWGIVDTKSKNWNLPHAIHTVVSPVERAIHEMRFGSINEATLNRTPNWHDDFFVCSGRDPLTELKLWSRTLALCSRYGDEPVAVLMGDIDKLKRINDKYGLYIGDLCIQMIAHQLRRLESNDVAAFRFGGDEFIVWTRSYSLTRAKQIAQKMSNFQIPIPGQEAVENISITWSVVATSPRDLKLLDLLENADALLHETKAEQRGVVRTQQMKNPANA